MLLQAFSAAEAHPNPGTPSLRAELMLQTPLSARIAPSPSGDQGLCRTGAPHAQVSYGIFGSAGGQPSCGHSSHLGVQHSSGATQTHLMDLGMAEGTRRSNLMWPKHCLSGGMKFPIPVLETLKADTEGSSQDPGRELRKKRDTGKSLSLQTSTIHKAASGLGLGKSFLLLSLLRTRH